MTRENKEREFFKKPSKRKEPMTITTSAHDKKRRAHEACRSLKRVLAKGSREQSNLRNMNRGGYEFADEDVEEMYEELLKHGKIRLLASQRPEEAGMTNHPRYY